LRIASISEYTSTRGKLPPVLVTLSFSSSPSTMVTADDRMRLSRVLTGSRLPESCTA